MAIEDYLNVAEPTDQVIETDAVIVGAGPVGLFQVFELGLLEIKAHVVDSLKNVGGQCMELYPTKPIYDIPAVPVYSSYELTENLLKQIHPFNPTFHLGEEVSVVKKREDGLFDVKTDKGTKFLCKVVIIAAGVGSFQARPLRVPGIEKFEGTQLHYRVRDPELFAGKNVMICGGGRVAYYLGSQLLELGMQVKIIELDEKRCMELCDLLPKATIIHGNATDLIFNVINCFLLLLGNISLSFCLNSGCLCLSFLDHGFTACCSVLLGILENGICSFFCFCHFSLIISLHGIRFFLCLFRILDLRISQSSSLLDDRAYRLEQEFLDQPALDEQVADLGNESPRYDRY